MDTAMLVGSFIPIIAILIVGIILLVPIAGLTARFALKPAIEAYAKLRVPQMQEEQLSVLERRLSLVEQQLHHVESSLRRVEDDTDFRRQLESPPPKTDAAGAPGQPSPVPVYPKD